MYTPVNPSFTIQKWGLRGSKLYRRVFVMQQQAEQAEQQLPFPPRSEPNARQDPKDHDGA